MRAPRRISIAAVGDVSFAGSHADEPSAELFVETAPRFRQSDLAIGNLESPLVKSGLPIQGKCTLGACPGWAEVLRDSGVGLVSLANNHMMDYGTSGLIDTMGALDGAGVRFVGAGLDEERACAPVFFACRGTRVACLARTSVVVMAPTYAKEGTPGVAFLDVEETDTAIRRCRQQADIVILLLHWGLEHYRYPSPSQRMLARGFVRAGADVILGHHPHVIQGIERIGPAVIAYSLGNFAFNEFDWEWCRRDGTRARTHIGLSTQNRQGLILELLLSPGKPAGLVITPTHIRSDSRVRPDSEQSRLNELRSVSSALSRRGYRLWWRLYAVQREWILRLKPQALSASRLGKMLLRIRLRHFRELASSLYRSGRIVLERSTNPYE